MFLNLTIENVKGANRTFTFAPGNLVQGRNFSGKSTVEQMLRAVALGYIPGIKPETSAAIKMFASDYPMRVASDLAGNWPPLGITFEKVKNAVKQTRDQTLATLNMLDEPTRVLFDPSIFFGLSDNARISKACELATSVAGDAAALRTSIVALIPPETTLYLRDCLKVWQEKTCKAAKTYNDLLAESETYWKEVKANRTAEKARMLKMAEGMTDMTTLEAELAKMPFRNEADGAKALHVSRIEWLTGKIESAKSLAAETERRRKRIEELKPIAADLPNAKERVQKATENLAAIAKEVAMLNEQAVNAGKAYEAIASEVDRAKANQARYRELTELAAQIPEREEAYKRAAAAAEVAAANEAKLRQTLSEARAALEKAQSLADAPVPVEAPVEVRTDRFWENSDRSKVYSVRATVQWSDQVPGGGGWILAGVEEWSELIAKPPVDEEAERNRQYELQQAVEEAEHAVSKTMEDLLAASGITEAACDERVLCSVQLDRCKTARMALEQMGAAGECPAAELVAKLKNDRDVTRSVYDDAVVRHDDAIEELNHQKAKLAEIARCAAELDSLQVGSTDTYATPEEIARWEGEREERKVSLAAVEKTIEDIVRYEQDKKRVADAARVREEVDTQLKIVGKIIATIAEKKQEVVSVSIEAPLAIANKLAAGILKGPLVFEEGEIGMRVGSQFISNRAFSGTEAAIVMMGLTAGLAARSKLRVLILDEIGRLDTVNAGLLVGNLTRMVAEKHIDQFILVGPDNPALVHLLTAAGGVPDLNIINIA